MELWHNPRCTKSRQAKELLDERGVDYEERRYLDRPPTAEELDAVLTAMGKEPWEITRMGESVAEELGLKAADKDRAAWIKVMVENPILIERPILVTDDGRAAVGRPTEAIADLL
jgi:arsenate reductase (glutaredoxin)